MNTVLQDHRLTIEHLFQVLAYLYERVIGIMSDVGIRVEGISSRTIIEAFHVAFAFHYLARCSFFVAPSRPLLLR